MERLSVFKALADGSRYSIYLEVARSSDSLSTTEIADRLDLHPSTVRLHLERLREAGLLEVSSERQGLVGRPQHRWSLASEAPALGLAPSGFRLLAQLLADVAARASLPTEELIEIGSHQGHRRGVTLRPSVATP
ncbi:MAG: helix-turn-helix transcriptional regulator, partial [Acidimicrobiales bacterium]